MPDTPMARSTPSADGPLRPARVWHVGEPCIAETRDQGLIHGHLVAVPPASQGMVQVRSRRGTTHLVFAVELCTPAEWQASVAEARERPARAPG
jgi:hypothetical protein